MIASFRCGMHEVEKNAAGTVTKTTVYYPAGGAMRVNGTLYYTLKDNLGSASVVTDSAGTIVGEQRYYPFGETRFSTGTLYTDKLFTGQRSFTDLGLYHYGARFYSPKIGRFISPDTIVPGFANPQNLNRFAYVRNNPVRYIDPTGHTVACSPYEDDCHVDGGDDDDDSGGNPPDDDDCSGNNDPDCHEEDEPVPPAPPTPPSNCPAGITCTTSDSSGAMGYNVLASQYAGNNCVADPNCWYATEAQISTLISALTVIQAVAGVISVGLITVGGFLIPGGLVIPGIAIIAAGAYLGVIEAGISIPDMKGYLNNAQAAAHSNGGVIEITKTDTLFGTTFNYTGASTSHTVRAPITRLISVIEFWAEP